MVLVHRLRSTNPETLPKDVQSYKNNDKTKTIGVGGTETVNSQWRTEDSGILS